MASPPEENGQLQELVGAIKTAFNGQSIPGPIAEAVAKVESASDKKMTKDLHARTAELGQARRQLHGIRKARDAQDASWLQYLQATTEALDKGSKEHEAKRADLDRQEKEARQRAGQARRAIRELASSSNAKSAEVVVDSDSFSDMEIGDAVAMDEDDSMVQAQKKLKTTMAALLTRIPDMETGQQRRKADDASKNAPPN